jgi:hypothetical protein
VRRRLPAGLTPERALALAGVTGLLLTGLVVLIMLVAAATGEDKRPIRPAVTTATPTPTPTATPKPKPTPVPLTAEQRTQRAAAAKIVTDKGFEVVKLRDWDPRRTLRVLLGRQTSGEPRRILAFFFLADGRYIGNDTTEASNSVRVKRTRDTVTTLSYATPDGRIDVRFAWDGSQLEPIEAIPDVTQRTAPR